MILRCRARPPASSRVAIAGVGRSIIGTGIGIEAVRPPSCSLSTPAIATRGRAAPSDRSNVHARRGCASYPLYHMVVHACTDDPRVEAWTACGQTCPCVARPDWRHERTVRDPFTALVVDGRRGALAPGGVESPAPSRLKSCLAFGLPG